MSENGRKLVTLDDVERRHLANHLEPYWGWIRLVLSLATGALTLLVSLQGHYVPKAPLHPWLLVAAWVLLLVSIASGLWALRWSHVGPMTAARNLRQLRARLGDAAAVQHLQQGTSQLPAPATHRVAVWLLSASFLLALAALCTFSALNVLR